jgi:ParB family chromosome partitioning protein
MATDKDSTRAQRLSMTTARSEEVELPIACLRPRPGNRTLADDGALEELAESIRIHGLLHRVQVRPGAEPETFEIIAGVRRWRAHQILGATTVPCKVHHPCSDIRAEEIRVAENEHREEPSAYDTAIGLRRIRNESGFTTHEQVSAQTGISATRVKKDMSIFGASQFLLDAIAKHRLSIGVAAELVRCEGAFGEMRARKFVKQAIRGEVGAADLSRRRTLAKHGKRAARSKELRAEWAAAGRRLHRLLARDLGEGAAHARQIIDELQAAIEKAGA